MLEETQRIINREIDFLPLTDYANIAEGNALRMDWRGVINQKVSAPPLSTQPPFKGVKTPSGVLGGVQTADISCGAKETHALGDTPRNCYAISAPLKGGYSDASQSPLYIIGNPPFVGYSLQSKEQKSDILSVYVDENGKPYKTAGKIDYVAGWYFKAAEFMRGTSRLVRAAFVSTNSITQGEQVAAVWQPLYNRFGVHIDFAHRTFRWDSESADKAHVHCVIVGFSAAPNAADKKIFDGGNVSLAENISPYLIDAPNIFIGSRKKPLCDVPEMVYGNKPVDGGFLFLSPKEESTIRKKDAIASKYVHKILGSAEYINGENRYCLWLVNATPADIRNSPFLKSRVENVREFRLKSTKEITRRSADTPALFQEIRQPNADYIIVPSVSSENRRYIPMGFISPDVIVSNAVLVIPDATLYHFGILNSNVHMAWMRAVCGRLEMRYRYSAQVVYNNFPWPFSTPRNGGYGEAELKAAIEKTAQGILDARALYPDSSLADLYDETTMPPELRAAHRANDKAVMAAYGFSLKMNEEQCVAELMKMYQNLVRSEE